MQQPHLIERCGTAYEQASEPLWRAFNQAWFTSLDIDEVEDTHIRVTNPERPAVLEALHTARPRPKPLPNGKPGNLVGCRVIGRVGGSNVGPLVELRGFEPLTPSMRTRCATGLRHSP